MIHTQELTPLPSEHERERASNSYLMSLVAVMAGLPIPIVNIIATFIFYFGNKKSSPFVRWHTIQALVSQLALFPLNTLLFWWTLRILFKEEYVATDLYFAYLIFVLLLNLTEFIITIIAAIRVRKGYHVSWYIFGDITQLVYPHFNPQNTATHERNEL